MGFLLPTPEGVSSDRFRYQFPSIPKIMELSPSIIGLALTITNIHKSCAV